MIQAESISVNKFNNATRPDSKLPKTSRENLERNLSFRITKQYHRDGVITTRQYLSKIVNIYRFIPKSKSDVESSSSEEEESTETESTATVSTLTASASALTLEETHLDSGNDADQLPFVSNPTST